MAYARWTVSKLKSELIRRNAVCTGRKEVLIERLEAYERNDNFKGVPVILPDPLIPHWPETGFKQLTQMHKIQLPKIRRELVDSYFEFRMAQDNRAVGDLKALEKGEALLASNRIEACSVHITQPEVHMTGIVRAAMKKKVTYYYKLRIDGQNAEVLNTHCECPAGKGPHGTCEHLAAVLLMLCRFMQHGELGIVKSCTEKPQSFHRPASLHSGSPIKSQNLPVMGDRKRHAELLEDPRKSKYVKSVAFGDRVRNHVINQCSNTSYDITMRFNYEKADLRTAILDHNYLRLPFTEYWVDESVKVCPVSAQRIELCTRKQAKCKKWMEEREWRLTASRFGEVCKVTERRNKEKMCRSLVHPCDIRNKAVTHGCTYEGLAIEKFEKKFNLKVKKCGLFVCCQFPYLAATPDGVIDDQHIIEVKCPYNGKDSEIQPGHMFPFLYKDIHGDMLLKETCNYYYQVQGQLYVCQKKFCFFIVYTHKDLFVQKIMIDLNYCEQSLVPKLTLFWEKYLRSFIACNL